MALVFRVILEGTADDAGDDRITLRAMRGGRPQFVMMVLPCEYLELTIQDVKRLRDALDECLSELDSATVKGGS